MGTFGSDRVSDEEVPEAALRRHVSGTVISTALPRQSRRTVSEPLTDEEMKLIEGIDRNCRLIKGQVFLWKDGQDWEDLWDVHGEITPA